MFHTTFFQNLTFRRDTITHAKEPSTPKITYTCYVYVNGRQATQGLTKTTTAIVLRRKDTPFWLKPRPSISHLRLDPIEGIVARNTIPCSPATNTSTPLRLLEKPVQLRDVLQRSCLMQPDERRGHDGRKLLSTSPFDVCNGLRSLLPGAAFVHGLRGPVGVKLLRVDTHSLLRSYVS